jgi:pyruvate carboxylase
MRITSATKDKPAIFPTLEAKRQALLEYSEMILKGTSTKDIFTQLMDRYQWTENQCIHFTQECRDTIGEATAENNEKIVEIHTLIYEDIYTRFDKLKYTKGKLATMAQKEKLLKLYEEESNEITINNQTNVIVQSNYDSNKLDPQQQARFQFLIDKASNNES